MIPDLLNRNLVPEWMDSPDLDEREHRRALAGLRRVNRICNPAVPIASSIRKMAQRRGMKELSILDVGCGSGDIAIRIQRDLNRDFVCHITGWDMSPVAIETANERVDSNSRIRFQRANILEPNSQARETYDFVYCSLFMHHFDWDESIGVLSHLKQLSRVSVLVDDLCRSKLGWIAAKLGCWVLSRSPIVHFDGPQSVRAAYTTSEFQQLAVHAGLSNGTIRKHWPERFLFLCEANPWMTTSQTT